MSRRFMTLLGASVLACLVLGSAHAVQASAKPKRLLCRGPFDLRMGPVVAGTGASDLPLKSVALRFEHATKGSQAARGADLLPGTCAWDDGTTLSKSDPNQLLFWWGSVYEPFQEILLDCSGRRDCAIEASVSTGGNPWFIPKAKDFERFILLEDEASGRRTSKRGRGGSRGPKASERPSKPREPTASEDPAWD